MYFAIENYLKQNPDLVRKDFTESEISEEGLIRALGEQIKENIVSTGTTIKGWFEGIKSK